MWRDNVKGGEAQGELVMALFPNGAKVMNLQGQPRRQPGHRPQSGPA
jgi:ABC-type sugar transport system substrate-binding protein